MWYILLNKSFILLIYKTKKPDHSPMPAHKHCPGAGHRCCRRHRANAVRALPSPLKRHARDASQRVPCISTCGTGHNANWSSPEIHDPLRKLDREISALWLRVAIRQRLPQHRMVLDSDDYLVVGINENRKFIYVFWSVCAKFSVAPFIPPKTVNSERANASNKSPLYYSANKKAPLNTALLSLLPFHPKISPRVTPQTWRNGNALHSSPSPFRSRALVAWSHAIGTCAEWNSNNANWSFRLFRDPWHICGRSASGHAFPFGTS